MTIIEGGFDPVRFIMLIISIILVLSALYLLTPFLDGCLNGITHTHNVDIVLTSAFIVPNVSCEILVSSEPQDGGTANCTFGGGGGSREWNVSVDGEP